MRQLCRHKIEEKSHAKTNREWTRTKDQPQMNADLRRLEGRLMVVERASLAKRRREAVNQFRPAAAGLSPRGLGYAFSGASRLY
jgi:hypothetical protein